MKKNLFVLDSYIEVIELKMSEFKEQWGLISKMAEACECQRSHLSKVLKGQLHLTLEQAQRISEFFKMNELETEYFLCLVELERAGSQSLKRRFQNRLVKIRQQIENLKERLNVAEIESTHQQLIYYSSWIWSAIHVATSIPEFQSVARLSQYFRLPENEIESYLKTLDSMGFVKKVGTRWTYNTQSIHLSNSSPMIGIHHNNWRARAVIDSQKIQTTGLHYTVVQSISKSDFLKLKALMLETIDQFSKAAGPSKSEELVNFSLDFYKVE